MLCFTLLGSIVVMGGHILRTLEDASSNLCKNFHIYIKFHRFGLDSGSGESTLRTLLEYNCDTS